VTIGRRSIAVATLAMLATPATAAALTCPTVGWQLNGAPEVTLTSAAADSQVGANWVRYDLRARTFEASSFGWGSWTNRIRIRELMYVDSQHESTTVTIRASGRISAHGVCGWHCGGGSATVDLVSGDQSARNQVYSSGGNSASQSVDLAVSIRVADRDIVSFELIIYTTAGGYPQSGHGEASGNFWVEVPAGTSAHFCRGGATGPSATTHLEEAEIIRGTMRARWRTDRGSGVGVVVDRSEDGGPWIQRATLTSDATGAWTFEEMGLAAFHRFDYRLRRWTPFGWLVHSEVGLECKPWMKEGVRAPRLADVPAGGVSDLPHDDGVLTVYDLAGRRLAVSTMPHGATRPTWADVPESASWAPGLYLAVLERAGTRRAFRMVRAR
jgi:hypothetical protein